MENGKKAAFAAASEVWHQLGLTKREYFASQALAGLMVQAIAGSHNINNPLNNDVVVKHAVDIADALLAELEKTKEE
jgi:hypothetical protein